MEVLYDVLCFFGVIFCLFVLLCGVFAITNFIFAEDNNIENNEIENSEVIQCSQENVTYISSEKEK